MKTHEVASILSALATALRKGPNVPLDELGSSVKRSKPNPEGIPLALSTLVALADFDKSQWLTFIRENSLPVDVRPRDASRDIIGKILNYLAENPEARQRLSNTAKSTRSETSPELMRALDLLLR